MKEEMKCPFHHGENMEVHVGSNVDAKDPVRSWWPDSLNLDVLAQQDQKTIRMMRILIIAGNLKK